MLASRQSIPTTVYDYVLPITGVDDELGYLLQTCLIVTVETTLGEAVKVKDAQCHLPPLCPENQGADDLTLRASIASDVPWIRIYVGHNECRAGPKRIRANTSTPSRGCVNELTGWFSAEGPQEQPARGVVGSRAVIHTHFWSRE